MRYKTIVLELIGLRPRHHERLACSGRLTSTLEELAMQLRGRHLELIDKLRRVRPESADVQLSSEAMEIAVHELELDLNSESPENDDETFSLDAAMAYVRRHTPPE
ncbi:MAG: hypothetical protein R3C19_26900 [Planctomycetaceae bacterium]